MFDEVHSNDGMSDLEALNPEVKSLMSKETATKVGSAYALADPQSQIDFVTQDQVAKELVEEGVSPTMTRVDMGVQDKNTNVFKDALSIVEDPSELVGLASTILEIEQNPMQGNYSSVLDEGLERAGFESLTENDSVENIDRLNKLNDNLTFSREQQSRMAALFDSEQARLQVIIPQPVQNDMGYSEGFDDWRDISTKLRQFGDTFLFPTARIAKTLSDVIPEEELGLEQYYSYGFGGSLYTALGEWINRKPASERVDALQTVIDAMYDNIEYDSYISDKTVALTKQDSLSFLRRAVIDGKTSTNDWLLAGMNLLAFAEIFGAVSLVTRGVREAVVRPDLVDATIINGRVNPSEPASMIIKADPESYELFTAAALDESGATASKLGTTPERIAASLLPQAGGDITVGVPSAVGEAILRAQGKAHELIQLPANTFTFTTEEFKKRAKRIKEIVYEEDGLQVPWRTGSFTTWRIEGQNAVGYEGVFGKNHLTGFSDPTKARQAASDFNDGYKVVEGEAPRVTGLFYRDDATDELIKEELLPNDYTPSEWFVGVNGSSEMTVFDAVTNVDALLLPSGPVRRHYLDPDSKFMPEYLNSAKIGNERKFLVRNNLVDIANPFINLGVKGKRIVARALQDGDAGEEVFDYLTLKDKYTMTDNEVAGYYSARTFWDTVYVLKNRQARDKLVADGYLRLVVSDPADATKTIFETGVKQVDELPDSVTTVIDANTGKQIDVTNPLQVEALLNKGNTFAKALQPIHTDVDGSFNYVLLNPLTKLQPLPLEVINRKTGHVTRLNTEPFYIVEEVKKHVVDGVDVGAYKRVIEAVSTRKAANNAVARLQSEVDITKSEFSSKIDENLVSYDDRLASDEQFMDGGVGYWFKHRGERLRNEDVQGNLGAIADPYETLIRTAESLSTVLSQSDVINGQVARIRATYPQFFGSSGNFLNEGSGFTPSPEQLLSYEKAKTAIDYTQQLRQQQNSIDKTWKNWMLSIDTNLTKLGISNKASTELLLSTLANNSPGKVVRTVAFLGLIVPRATVQVLLQGSSAFHMAGVSPVAMSKAVRDTPLLVMSIIAKTSPEAQKLLNQMARAAGYAPEEWAKISKEFINSGKYQSIDSNLFISEMNYSMRRNRIPATGTERVGQLLAQTAKAPVQFTKAIGFDFGEIVNHATSWNFERHHFGKDWAVSQFNKDVVNANARSWAFDMTKTGSFTWQQNSLANMTQFLSISQKAKLNLVPIIGNKRFVGTRGDYMVGLALMYGITGFGLGDFSNQMTSWLEDQVGFDIPEPLRSQITGGLLDAVGNTALASAGQDMSTLNLSGRFSPSSSVFAVEELIAGMFAEDRGVLKTLSGAGGGALSSIYKSAQAALNVFYYEYEDGTDAIVRLSAGVSRFSQDFGPFGQYHQYRVAQGMAKEFDKWFVLSKTTGQPIAEVTRTEFMTRLLTAVKLKSETDLWSVVAPTGRVYRKEVIEQAKSLSKEMARILRDNPYDVAFAKIQRISKAHANTELMRLEVLDRARVFLSRDSNFEKLYLPFIEANIKLDKNASMSAALKEIDNFTGLSEDQKVIAKYKVKGMFESIKIADVFKEEGKE